MPGDVPGDRPGDTPGGGASSNPFGIDMNEIMRLLQSPGPVNMEVARKTAETMAAVDIESGEWSGE